MYTEEKKKNTNYGSIFLYCFLSFLVVVEVVRFAKPYYNLRNIMETTSLVEEGFLDVENSKLLPCHPDDKKLKGTLSEQTRTRPPISYCVKFQSFPTMQKLVENNGGKYESRPFSIGGYNWTFIIYPNENMPVGSGAFVSLYVRIDNTTLIANPRDVYAWIKFVTYRSTTNIYHELQATEAQRFHLFKQEYGQPNFLEIGYYKDVGQGYIFDGEQSVFGVDIVVSKPSEWEVASYEENIRDPILDWELTKFSTYNLTYYGSGWYYSGERNWVLKMYPNGVGYATGNWLSLYLSSASENGYVKANFRVIDQIQSNHFEKQMAGWPNAADGWGFDTFIPLADLKNATKGYVVNDTIIFEVEILSFSKTDTYSV